MMDNEIDFESFEDFIEKFPLDEITIPVAIESPDDESDYWLIQIALPMRNQTINCCVWRATPQQLRKYKELAISMYEKCLNVNNKGPKDA